MKIIYKNDDATQIPVYMSGTCIQIKQWLRGEQFVPFLKSVFSVKNNELTEREIEDLTFEKRQEEAEQADRSELEEYYNE